VEYDFLVGVVSKLISNWLIWGGDSRKTNRVPDHAGCQLEIRSRDQDKVDSLIEVVTAVFNSSLKLSMGVSTAPDLRRCQVDIKRLSGGYPRFLLPDSDPVCQIAAAAIRESGLTPKFEDMPAGFDGNWFNAKGVASVGLGVGLRDPHANSEYLLKSELVQAVEVGLNIVRLFNR